MTIARHYVMHAKEGMEAALEAALHVVIDAVRPLPGSEGVELLRDIERGGRFMFIEKWVDVDAHKAAGKMLDKSVFAPMIAAMDGPPEGAYLDYLCAV